MCFSFFLIEPRRIKHVLAEHQSTVSTFHYIELFFYENKIPKSNRPCGTRLVPYIKGKVLNKRLYFNENISVTKLIRMDVMQITDL